MKRKLVLGLALAAALGGCDLFGPDFSEPNMPDTFDGRPVEVLGTIDVGNRNVVLSVWDHGQIDGDIISLVVNGRTIVSNYTLTGSPQSFNVQLNPEGYSYVLLYAHNEGDLSPNTAALSVFDGISEQTNILEASLETNGAYHVVVGGG